VRWENCKPLDFSTSDEEEEEEDLMEQKDKSEKLTGKGGDYRGR